MESKGVGRGWEKEEKKAGRGPRAQQWLCDDTLGLGLCKATASGSQSILNASALAEEVFEIKPLVFRV